MESITTLLNWRDEVIVLYEYDKSVNSEKAKMTLIWADWEKDDFKLNWDEMEENGGTALWPSDGEIEEHPWEGQGLRWEKQIEYDTRIVTIPVGRLEYP